MGEVLKSSEDRLRSLISFSGEAPSPSLAISSTAFEAVVSSTSTTLSDSSLRMIESV